MTRFPALLGLLGGLCALPALAHDDSLPATDKTTLDRVVASVCQKDMVLLGEDARHAAAGTLALKVRLVERLVQECGFGGVVFESQFYDMLDFDQAASSGTAKPQQLTDAVGMLWSRFPQFTPLNSWLFDAASTGRVRVGGMDPQVGGAGALYAQQQLPTRLASALQDPRRGVCETAIGRHNRWEYDDTHAFDATALQELRDCLRDVQSRLDAQASHGDPAVRAMAASYAAYLTFANGDSDGLRDQAMYRNFRWLRERWPKGMRIVVWSASVHAAKSLPGGTRPFGSYVHAELGDRAAAIGFSALSGHYGNVGGRRAPQPLAPAAPGSLEARAFAGAGTGDLRYLDHAQLQALGTVPGRALDYANTQTLDWSQLLDGVIVLREERAAQPAP